MKIKKKLTKRTWGDGVVNYIATVGYEILNEENEPISRGVKELVCSCEETAKEWIDEQENMVKNYCFTDTILDANIPCVCGHA